MIKLETPTRFTKNGLSIFKDTNKKGLILSPGWNTMQISGATHFTYACNRHDLRQKGYRDDLNFNFGLLEALIGEASGVTDALREEMLGQINNLQQQIDMLTGENIGELLARLNDLIQQALTAAQDARTATTAMEQATALTKTATELANVSATLAEEKASYAEDKAILAQEAATTRTRSFSI